MLCSLPYASYANCTGTSATFSFGAVSAGNTNIGSSFATSRVSITYTCSDAGARTDPGVVASVYNNWSFQTLPVGTGVAVGSFTRVFPTNIAGVGIAFKELSTNIAITDVINKNSFCWSNPLVQDPCNVMPSGRCSLPGVCTLNIQADLVKTGTVSAGALNGLVMNLSYYAYLVRGGTRVGTLDMNGTVTNTTCSVAPVTVDLGEARTRDLNNGTPSPAKPVNLKLVCDKPPQNITYQMSPQGSIIFGNTCNGTMQNAAPGTARNAGIRFTRGGTNICWNTSTPTNIVAGSNRIIDIPFSAQMVGTGGGTTAGSVAGKAVATFSYQ